jgi:hypothetical protein
MSDGDQDFALSEYVSAMGDMFQQVDTLASATNAGPGWSQIMDINRCPSYGLGWLAQFVGVTLDPALDDASQRSRIRSTDGWNRGSPNAMIAAAQQYLTGTKYVILRERNGSPYHITVVTKLSETPNSLAVLNALLAQKPAGLTLTLAVEAGQDYETLFEAFADYGDVFAAYPNYLAMLLDT